MKPRILAVSVLATATAVALLAGTGTDAWLDPPSEGDIPTTTCPPPNHYGFYVQPGTPTCEVPATTTTTTTTEVKSSTTTTCPDCVPNTQGATTTTTTTSTTTTTTNPCPDPPCIPNTQGATTTSIAPTTTATAATTTTVVATTSSSAAPTTTTSPPPSTATSTSTSSTLPTPSSSTTTLPATLDIGSASTVCRRDAPFVTLTFGNQPEFNGHVGTITFLDLNGNVIEVHAVEYQALGTVELVYPGAVVAADGTALDWPGWMLNDDGYWVLDPTDAIYRDGITIVAEINPTATTTISYPPETAACASPDGPFPPTPQQLPATQ